MTNRTGTEGQRTDNHAYQVNRKIRLFTGKLEWGERRESEAPSTDGFVYYI